MNDNQEEKPDVFWSPRNEIQVAIFYNEANFPVIGIQQVWKFLHAFPYKDADGGVILRFNPLRQPPFAKSYYGSKEEMFKALKKGSYKALKENPDMQLVYLGKILREDSFEDDVNRRF